MYRETEVKWEVEKNAKGLWSSYHTMYRATMTYNGVSYIFPYQCHRDNTPTKYDVIFCAMADAQSYGMCKDILEFVAEFGYSLSSEKQIQNARDAYAQCERAYEKLNYMYDSTENWEDIMNEELEENRE